MPTQTFFHLPKEKQKRLIEAARIEFSRVPLKEASIANIVKLADIPRGSFYQYFEDKEDLYFYYFETMRRDSSKDMLQLMKESDGDLFKGFESYFSKMIYEILEGENASFYRNLFMNRITVPQEKSLLIRVAKKRLMIHIKNTNKMQKSCLN